MSASGITGIDHVLVGVSDLEGARRQWKRLGFTLTPRGRHIGWGTGNYCAMLASSYIELLGIVERSEFLNGLDRFLERGEGLMGLAFATEDEVAAAAALRSAGLIVEGPKTLRRRLELPEGPVEPEFGLVMLPESVTPGLSAFICRHKTPQLVRRPHWQIHENGALALEEVTIVIADADWPRLLPAYRLLFGSGAIAESETHLKVETGAGCLTFTDREGLLRHHPWLARLSSSPFPEAGNFIAGLRIGIGRLAACRDHLRRYRISFEDRETGILVKPAEACGLILEFSERR